MRNERDERKNSKSQKPNRIINDYMMDTKINGQNREGS
jgi:hypothetical protein